MRNSFDIFGTFLTKIHNFLLKYANQNNESQSNSVLLVGYFAKKLYLQLRRSLSKYNYLYNPMSRKNMHDANINFDYDWLSMG